MSSSNKIENVIKSTKKTKDITNAMQLVAASKLPNALDRLRSAKPFSDIASSMMTDYSACSDHPYFKLRDSAKKEGLIIVSSDRGLCGNLNLGLFKQSLQLIKKKKDQGITMVLSIIGTKGIQVFSQHGSILSQIEKIGDRPNLRELMGLIHPMITAFEKEEIDQIHIASNTYVSTLSQTANISVLLPIVQRNNASKQNDYEFEPNEQSLMNSLLRHYIESQFYRTVVENIACEQAARMIAMKNATDNASDLIEDLNLTYNKARQASITQEIAEIAAGTTLSDGEAS